MFLPDYFENGSTKYSHHYTLAESCKRSSFYLSIGMNTKSVLLERISAVDTEPGRTSSSSPAIGAESMA